MLFPFTEWKGRGREMGQGRPEGGEGDILGRGNANSETPRRGADLCLRNGKQAVCLEWSWGLGREEE